MSDEIPDGWVAVDYEHPDLGFVQRHANKRGWKATRWADSFPLIDDDTGTIKLFLTAAAAIAALEKENKA